MIVAPSGAHERAIAEQTRGPRSVVVGDGVLATGLARALEAGTDWLWLLEPSTVPRAEALEALVAALDRAPERPALMASAVHDARGGIDRARAPIYRRTPTQLAMAAAAARLLPIRAATGPVLVHRSALLAVGAPRARLAGPPALLHLTGRLLGDRVGFLVPRSISAAAAGTRRPTRGFETAATLLLGDAFTGADRLRVGLELFSRARSRRGS